ncbi:MAG: heterodisulfide reductase-related iron-sulfur binding cluster [Candidatus Nezhaarchaeales archaeon]
MSEELLLWIGCTSSYKVPELALSLMYVLRALKIDFKYLGLNEGCCGSILLRLGLKRWLSEVAKKTLDTICSTEAQKLVTHCPGCLRTFKLDYPSQLGITLSLEVQHSTQLILDHLKLSILKPIEIKAVYFDPCHLGRHMNVYEPPRHILNMIPGMKLIELNESKETSLCCGAGGGVRACFEELAQAVAQELLDYIKLTGAEAIITACPFCYHNLKSASNASLKVLDITQVIRASIDGDPHGVLGR